MRGRGVGGRVVEPQPHAVAARLGDASEHVGRQFALGAAVPTCADRDVAHQLDAPAQVRRQHRHDFGERADRRLGDVCVDAVGGAVQPDGERDRLALVEQQRGHGGAGRQLVAAVDTATRLDGIAELAEPVDVAAQGAM